MTQAADAEKAPSSLTKSQRGSIDHVRSLTERPVGRPSKHQFSLIPRPEFEGRDRKYWENPLSYLGSLHSFLLSRSGPNILNRVLANSRRSVVIFRDILAPIQIFSFPIILWAAFSLNFAANCLLSLNLTQSQVFAAPPYLFSPAQVGFVNFAFVVGGVIGLLTAGPFSDWVSMRATARNEGVREAEMRLVALVPYVCICLVGMTVSLFHSMSEPQLILEGYCSWLSASLALASCGYHWIWLRWYPSCIDSGNSYCSKCWGNPKS
jgi:MFS family permease